LWPLDNEKNPSVVSQSEQSNFALYVIKGRNAKTKSNMEWIQNKSSQCFAHVIFKT
jgi:hypothetical protein